MLLSSRAAASAVVAMFAVNGLLVGAYAGSLPSLRDHLHLQGAQLPVLLLVVGAFALIAMQVGGRAADRHGGRQVALASIPLMAAGCLVLGFAPGWAVALAGGALFGLGNGAMDVAMNAYGVEVEKARTRPIMSFFHAMWSFGNFLGAGLILSVSFLAGIEGPATLVPVMVTVAVAALAVGAGLARWAPASRPVHADSENRTRGPIPAAAWLMGLMAVAFGLGEGTAYDWSSIHVRDVAGVSTSTAALGLVAVNAFMVAIRLLGDRLVARFGRRAVVRFGGLCAGLGYAVTAFAPGLGPILVGWSLVGFGIGMIAPQVYAVAGHLGGGRMLAIVVTFGYATFLAGPAVTGLLITALGIRLAMIVPALLCLSLLALAAVMPADDPDLAATT